MHLGSSKILWRGTVENIPENELPIDDGYDLVDGTKLTVGETSTSRRWVTCRGSFSFDHSTSHLYSPKSKIAHYGKEEKAHILITKAKYSDITIDFER